MSYVRTPEHRRLRAELIRNWKPWEKSTGPKTPEGKAKASRNGYKGGTRALLRELARVLRASIKIRDALARDQSYGGTARHDDNGQAFGRR
jgi:hypothetical protein